MQPSGAVSPTKGVPAPNPTDDPSAKEDNTLQQNLIDELQNIRDELSSMMAEDAKQMRGQPAVITDRLPVASIAERDRRAKREKLEQREQQVQKELKNLRLEGMDWY